MKRLPLILALTLFSAPVRGQDSLGVVRRTEARLNPIAGEGQTLLYKGLPSYTSAAVGYNFRTEDEAFLPQEGRGISEFVFEADAAHRLDKNTAVSGAASYRRGVKRDVFLNTSSDWELLYPYFTADTVGGNLQKEEYKFNGAYMRKFGAYFVGGKVDFRALHEYRAADPRPRNITSDLGGIITAGLEMQNHALSADIKAGKYHQSGDVEFMDQRGYNTSIFHMTGLGQHYGRFAGSGSSMNVRYRGMTLGGAIRLEPLNGKGWFGELSYEGKRYIRHIKNQNEAPMSRLWVHDAALSAGRKTEDLLVEGIVNYQYRKGYEAVLDVKGAYLSLADLPLYGQHRVRAEAIAVKSVGKWSFSPKAGFEMLSGANLNPARSISISAADASFGAQRLERKGLWLTCLNASAEGHFTLSKSLSIPAGKTDAKLYDIYSALYSRWSGHWGGIALTAMAQREIGKDISVFGKADAGGRIYSGGHNMIIANISIGLIF